MSGRGDAPELSGGSTCTGGDRLTGAARDRVGPAVSGGFRGAEEPTAVRGLASLRSCATCSGAEINDD